MHQNNQHKKSFLLHFTLFSYGYYLFKIFLGVGMFFIVIFLAVTRRLRNIFLILGSWLCGLCGNVFYFFSKMTLWLTRPLFFSPPLRVVRSVNFFLLLSIFLLTPFGILFSLQSFEKEKNNLMVSFQNGFTDLTRGYQSLERGDSDEGGLLLRKSEKEFKELAHEIHRVPTVMRKGFFLLGGTKGKEFHNAEIIVDIGIQASSLGLKISDLTQEFKKNASLPQRTIQREAQELTHIKNDILQKISHLEHDGIPDHYQHVVASFKKESTQYADIFDDIIHLGILMSSLSGIDTPKRYLVIFQNNTELRATGGFMGSFALIDIQNGIVTKMEIPSGGSYDIKGSLSAHNVPPFPLLRLIGEWQFQDSNWFADFPTSARKIQWFFSKSDGPSLDGILAVNATFAERILSLTGPIEMPEYKKIITEKNIIEEIEKAVELEYDPSKEKPKQFLTDLIPRVLSRLPLDDKKVVLNLLSLLPESIQKKELQLYVNDSYIQNFISQFGLSGELKETTGDYLQIVHSNIGGRKTDAVMDEVISHVISPAPDGSLVSTLTIQRTHKGSKGNFFNGVQNDDFLRVYIPQGSKLLAAEGFQILNRREFQNPKVYAQEDEDLKKLVQKLSFDPQTAVYTHEESGKNVISGWVITPLGKTSRVTLSYKLPFKKMPSKPFTYSLTHQHQSGARSSAYTFSYEKKPKENVLWTNRHDMIEQKDRIVFSQNAFDRDIIIGIETQEELYGR